MGPSHPTARLGDVALSEPTIAPAIATCAQRLGRRQPTIAAHRSRAVTPDCNPHVSDIHQPMAESHPGCTGVPGLTRRACRLDGLSAADAWITAAPAVAFVSGGSGTSPFLRCRRPSRLRGDECRAVSLQFEDPPPRRKALEVDASAERRGHRDQVGGRGHLGTQTVAEMLSWVTAGWDVLGIEPSPQAATTAARRGTRIVGETSRMPRSAGVADGVVFCCSPATRCRRRWRPWRRARRAPRRRRLLTRRGAQVA